MLYTYDMSGYERLHFDEEYILLSGVLLNNIVSVNSICVIQQYNSIYDNNKRELL